MLTKIKIKRFLPSALVLVFFAVVFFSPLGAHNAEASVASAVAWWVGDGIVNLLVRIANILMWLVSLVVWVAGLFFDLTLKISIIDFHSYANMPGIMTGWTIARDTINIFFIFILLYIAIATILQIAGYGIKDLLVKVIIIALLVNFSGVVTKVVIDASNVIAVEFYSKITAEADVSSVLMQGLRLQTVYKDYDNPDIDADPTKPGIPIERQLSAGGVLVGTLGGTLLMLVTAFVLFAAGALFLIRTITLLFLIILAPLAFAGMILPATSSHAKKWWSTLFAQSFFAPAYMFMIYLVVRIISEDNLTTAIGLEEGAGIMDFVFKGSINTLVYFIILIGLMIGSLIVASKMGAVGSSTVMKWGNTARKWGQGQVGRMTKRGAGFVAEKTLDEKSWINQKTGGNISGAMRRIPLAARGAARASSWREQQLKAKKAKYEKKYGSYSSAGLSAMQENPDKLSLRSKTLKRLGVKDVRGDAVKEAHDKRKGKEKADDRKKENIENEHKEYNEREARVKNPSNPWVGKDPVDLKKEIANIDAETSSLENVSPESIKNDPSLQAVQEDIKKKKMELAVKKASIQQEQEDRERMRQIEENRERRVETEKIEERVSKVEGASSGKSEKKEKPTS